MRTYPALVILYAGRTSLLLPETELEALLTLMALGAHFVVHAQTTAQSLPAPSRVIYKCVVAGKTAYTDEPCLGAKLLHIEPSRDLSKFSGKEMIGADVQRENHRDMMADAIRPLAGLNHQQYATVSRRVNLAGAAKAECGMLDQTIPRSEAMEAASSREARPPIQRDLLLLRQRFKELRC
jgi:hypothetical protein